MNINLILKQFINVLRKSILTLIIQKKKLIDYFSSKKQILNNYENFIK